MRNNLNLHWSHALQGFQELVNISVLNFPESLNSIEIGEGHLALRSWFLLQHKCKASPCCPDFWSSSCHWNSTHRNQFYSCPPQEVHPGHWLGLSLVKLFESRKSQDLVTKRTETSCWSLEQKSPVGINIPKVSYWNLWSNLGSVTLGSWELWSYWNSFQNLLTIRSKDY